MNVAREIAKLFMFAILWAIPLATKVLVGSTSVWLYLISVIGTFILFNHYETLERREQKGEEDEAAEK